MMIEDYDPTDWISDALWRDNRQKRTAKLEAERKFLQSLDWTDAQLARYNDRIMGIEQRLDVVRAKYNIVGRG